MSATLFNSVVALLAFVVALSVLIVVHEYGHYRMAVACGVKVLRFSLGFGKPILTWKRGADQTEFAIAPFPFGGYVRMLDGREGEIPLEEKHRAFNHKPLLSRILIVAAGPVANFILAILLLAMVSMLGMSHYIAKMTQPTQGSMFEQTGIQYGDMVTGASIGDGERVQPVSSFNELAAMLQYATLNEQDVRLQLQRPDGTVYKPLLPLSTLGTAKADKNLMFSIGFNGVWIKPMLRTIVPNSAAQRAGLQAGDMVKTINGQTVEEGRQLAKMVQTLPLDVASVWHIERNGQILEIQLVPDRIELPAIAAITPESALYQAGFREGDLVLAVNQQRIQERERLTQLIENTVDKHTPVTWIVERNGSLIELKFALTDSANITGRWISKIGSLIDEPEMVTIRYGALKSITYGADQTWFFSRFILTSIGKMIVGKAKVQDNLGGPIAIAMQAGESARNGLPHYLQWLAMISISLGVLNLLPLPVLDGGHLLLYMIEGVRRKPLSEQWMGYFQRAGVLLLLMLMLFVIFNDVLRLMMS